MTINEDIFQYFCSTASSPIGYGVLPLAAQKIESAKGTLLAMVGQDVYDEIADISGLEAIDVTDGDQTLQLAAYRYVCYMAMYEAIPQLDLTLSPTGFGVVSNQNVAPASSDRVERLRREMKNQSDDALDEVIDNLRGDKRWCETPVAKRWFSTLIWRGGQLRLFGYPNPHRTELLQNKPKILAAERELRNKISPEQFDELADSQRMASTTDIQHLAIDLCSGYISSYVGGNPNDVSLAMKALLFFLENNIEFFPTYRASRAYEANHFTPYENKKDDTCYFFG